MFLSAEPSVTWCLVSLLVAAVALVLTLFTTVQTGAPAVAYLGASVVWAVVMLQFAFVGHDACHFTGLQISAG